MTELGPSTERRPEVSLLDIKLTTNRKVFLGYAQKNLYLTVLSLSDPEAIEGKNLKQWI